MSIVQESPAPSSAPEPGVVPPSYTSPPAIPQEEAAKGSRKAILIAVVLIVVVIGAGVFAYAYTQTSLFGTNNAVSNPNNNNTGYNTYTSYGFSFQYPKGMTINTRGFLNSTISDNNNGIILVQNPSDQKTLAMLAWTYTTNSQGDLNGALGSAVNGFTTASNGSGLTTGSVSTTTTRSGYTVYYETFSVTLQGTHLNGVWSIWYSSHTQRLYQLMFVSPASSASATFNAYLSSFTEQ